MTTRLKATTMANKKWLLNQHIIPKLGKLKIDEISAVNIRKWQNELLKSDYSPTYIKSINNQLAVIFDYAVKIYDLPSNPCRAAGSIGKCSAGEMNICTKNQYEHFASFIRKPAAKVLLIFFSTLGFDPESYWL